MKRVLVLGGGWSLVLTIGSVCLAADAKRQGNQPAPSQSPAANSSGGDTNRRAAEARRAAQAAASRAAAARPALAPQPSRPAPTVPSAFGYGDYGYYVPSGTTPYVMSYDPYSGQAYLYPYSGGYSPYGYQNLYYGNPYLGFSYPGAVLADPSQLYGIGPIQQLMGVAPGGHRQANVAPVAPAEPDAVADGSNNQNPGFVNGSRPGPSPAAGSRPPAVSKPVAGGKSLELAWKFITFGDARFGDLKYNEALDRYHRAARECPKLGDAWIREGFALAAMDKYDQAAKAIRRGLEEKPDWADSNFRLDDVYGNNGVEQAACVDRMVKAAEAEPTNGDLALVVGIHLYSEGKVDQAAPFFRRAAQIQGNDSNVRPFLDKVRRHLR